MSERKKVKTVKNGILWSDGTVTISKCRISYPHLDKAWAKKPDETKKFSCVGILATDTHQEAIDLLIEQSDKILADKNDGKKVKDDALFIRDGDRSGKPEYEGAWTVNASESRRPAVLNSDKTEMDIDDIADEIWPGATVDLLIEPWWQDNEHGKRVNASLRGCRFRGGDEEEDRIGEGGMDSEEVVSSFDDDGDDYDGDESDEDMGGL